MSLVPPHPRGLRQVVTVGHRKAHDYRDHFFHYLPCETRGLAVRGSLALEWNTILLNLSRRVHSTEAIELGERVACQLGNQDIAAVLAPLRYSANGTLF